MPLKRSNAFVLKSMKYGESDRIVTFFSRDFGKIAGIAKGAVRSRKRFGGALELLSEVNVTYEEREGRELGRIDNCDLVMAHVRSQEDIKIYYAFSYMAEMVDLFSGFNEADKRFYRLMQAVILAIEQKITLAVCIRYFEIWVLRLHGLFPEIEHCSSCGKETKKSGGHFIDGAGEFLCPACSHSAQQRGMRVSDDAIRFVAAVMRKSVKEVDEVGVYRESFDAQLEEFLHSIFKNFHDKPFKSYRYIQECLKK